MIDRNKKFFISQKQLEVGLTELNIHYDFWPNIKKNFSKRLYYI